LGIIDRDEGQRPSRRAGGAGKPTGIAMDRIRAAKFQIGQVVRHRFFPFRGVVFDVDPVFNNTEEWWLAIPEEIRPRKDQPYYHLFAENAETEYVAYVSEQNLLPDTSGAPLRHPSVKELFAERDDGQYRALYLQEH
jgi:heat shock protein HspQ